MMRLKFLSWFFLLTLLPCRLGADVIYDPSCLPHLVRVLSIYLNRRITTNNRLNGTAQACDKEEDCSNGDCSGSNKVNLQVATLKSLLEEMETGPVALIASVIRNIDTFNCFLKLCCQNDLLVKDMTESIRPDNLLPYMKSYNRSDVRLLMLSYMSKWTSICLLKTLVQVAEWFCAI